MAETISALLQVQQDNHRRIGNSLGLIPVTVVVPFLSSCSILCSV